MFDISGKVALVTGGASGIGFRIVKELLRNGLRGCTIADVNETFGKDAIDEIDREFGVNRAIFIKTDTVDKEQFEEAFKATVKKFKNVDILVNNAGILNDAIWERQIQINVQGVVNGVLLGLEDYLQKYRTGAESIIINSGSVVSIDCFKSLPVYTATKHAVLGLTRSFGAQEHYERTKVKVMAVCPGITNTPLVAPEFVRHKTLGTAYTALLRDDADVTKFPRQEPEDVSKAVAYVISNGTPGSVWVAEGSEPAYEIGFLSRREMKKDVTK